MSNSQWYVYTLQSTVSGRFYTGITTDLGRRLKEHNNSKRGAKATRAGRPWQIIYFEEVLDQSTALRKEIQWKQLTRAQKLAKFKGVVP